MGPTGATVMCGSAVSVDRTLNSTPSPLRCFASSSPSSSDSSVGRAALKHSVPLQKQLQLSSGNVPSFSPKSCTHFCGRFTRCLALMVAKQESLSFASGRCAVRQLRGRTAAGGRRSSLHGHMQNDQRWLVVRAMVATGGSGAGGGGSSSSAWAPSAASMEAKEMERVTAKESLLLAIKDAGGWESSFSGKTSSAAVADVNEKVLALERLNTVPRPTTSPLFEGRWQFAWTGVQGPLLLAASSVLGQMPPQLATVDSLQLLITSQAARVSAVLRILSSVVTILNLTCKLSVEGPTRLTEEFVEGAVDMPSLAEDTAPDILKSWSQQLNSLVQSLPSNVTRTLEEGLKIPLAGSYSRRILVSYLDEEILIARDQAGTPEVLVRMNLLDSDSGTDEDYVPPPEDYES